MVPGGRSRLPDERIRETSARAPQRARAEAENVAIRDRV